MSRGWLAGLKSQQKLNAKFVKNVVAKVQSAIGGCIASVKSAFTLDFAPALA